MIAQPDPEFLPQPQHDPAGGAGRRQLLHSGKRFPILATRENSWQCDGNASLPIARVYCLMDRVLGIYLAKIVQCYRRQSAKTGRSASGRAVMTC